MSNIESTPSPDNLRKYFSALCEAAAYRWANHDEPLNDVVDRLQSYAEANGSRVIRALGQDAVQQLIAAAFIPFQDFDR